jgi:hypothetical protein
MAGLIETLSDILSILTSDESGNEQCAAMAPFCRVAVYPGDEVPLDSCEVNLCGSGGGEGQLWAAVQGVTLIEDDGGCIAWMWNAEVGAVRCAAKTGDDQKPPSVDAVQSDAVRQALDADAILRGIVCCPERNSRIDHAGIVVDGWEAIVGGGCVGGKWNIRGRFDVCC